MGLAAVRLGGKWGFVNEAGKEVVPCRYDEVRDFEGGLAAVRREASGALWIKRVRRWCPASMTRCGILEGEWTIIWLRCGETASGAL